MPTTIRPPAISVSGLRKVFGDHTVLDGIDLTVPSASVFALLGPNGAGKTTTVNILSTLIPPDGGSAAVAGHDVERAAAAVRAVIGVTGQHSAVDGLLTGEENLRLMAELNHLPRAAGRRRARELLARFDLADVARKQVATYSGGMRRKLDLAMTLMGDPAVIFLDEPTTGLDPRARRDVWEIVRGLVRAGITIFLTTQYLDEADCLAERIAVLDGGRIVAQGSPAELKRHVPGGTIHVHLTDPADLDNAAQAIPEGVRDDDQLTLSLPGSGDLAALQDVLDRLERSRVTVGHLDVTKASLDDAFLALTGYAAREELR